MTPRVLFVGGFPPPDSPIRGGVVTSCRVLLESSFSQSFDLVLLDTTQRSIPRPGVLTRARYAALRLVRFVWLLERHRPDAVLAFASQGGSFVEKAIGAWYARLRRVPTVLLLRGGPFMADVRRSRGYRRLARVLLRGAAVIPCQGEVWRRFFRDELGLDDARLPVVYNWTAPPDYLAVARPASPRAGPLRILFLAWIDRGKGIFELVDAVTGLSANPAIPDFELDIAGGGAQAEELAAILATRGLGDRVRLHGWVHGEAKRALFERADVYVLPSYSEGMPNAMIEAMAMALPVVVTPVGSVPDILRDGENGLLVPVRDAEALRAALARLLVSPALRERLGTAARITAAERFGRERGAEGIRAAILAAIGGRSAHAAAADRCDVPTPP